MLGRPRLSLERSALLVVDMQNDFVHPDGGFGVSARRAGSTIDFAALNGTIPKVAALLEAVRASSRPVVYITHVLRADYSDAAFPYWRAGPPGTQRKGKFLIEGTWGAQVVDDLAPAPGDHVVVKKGFDGFSNTTLDLVLRNCGVDTCVVCGVKTCVCVSSTVRGASERNYHVVVVGDACADNTRQWHEAELVTMSRIFADVLDVSTVVDMYTDVASHAADVPPTTAIA
jgi:ureidoacrylate peracid hydrolase